MFPSFFCVVWGDEISEIRPEGISVCVNASVYIYIYIYMYVRYLFIYLSIYLSICLCMYVCVWAMIKKGMQANSSGCVSHPFRFKGLLNALKYVHIVIFILLYTNIR